MKKVLFLIATAIISLAVMAADSSWSKAFTITSGSEPSFGLFEGKTVYVTRENYEFSGSDTYIVEIPSFPENVKYYFQAYSDGGMRSLTSGSYKCGRTVLQIKADSQTNPNWLRIGNCELRSKR